MWVFENAMKDSQTVINLLVNCFLGNTSVYHYVADQEALMIRKAFAETFCEDLDSNDPNIMHKIKEHVHNIIHLETSAEKHEAKDEILGKVELFLASYINQINWLMAPERIKLLSHDLYVSQVEVYRLLNRMIDKCCKKPKRVRLLETYINNFTNYEKLLSH